jgi:hypothetical protein
MKKLNIINWGLVGLVALLITTSSSFCMADDKPQDSSSTVKKGEKSAASPECLFVDEDFWFPLRFEPLLSIEAAETHYRQNEEKSAADEINKAVSWLKFAAGHARPITKGKLTSAADELKTIAKDLRKGEIGAAHKLVPSLAKAAHALSEWHYYKAKESWGRSDEKTAGNDLEMAVDYLQHAANSAHFQFGPDTQEVITKIYRNGKMTSEKKHVDHNTLGIYLEEIEKAIKELGDSMVKASK